MGDNIKKLLAVVVILTIISSVLAAGFAVIPGDIIIPGGPAQYTWSKVEADASVNLNDVTYGNNMYVAVGENGLIKTSLDGALWSLRDSKTASRLNDVIWDGNRFLAVGANGTVLKSTDGINWTPVPSGLSTEIRGIQYGNGIYVAACRYGEIFTSHDAVNWTLRKEGVKTFPIPPGGDQGLTDVIWTGKFFIAPGFNGALRGVVNTSEDGITWKTIVAEDYTVFTGAACNDSIMTVVGNYGIIYTSNDGLNWVKRSSGGDNFCSIVWDGKMFVAAGYNGRVSTSTDGMSWYSVSSGVANTINGIAISGNTAVMVGNGIILKGTKSLSAGKYKVSGYIAPNFYYDESVAGLIKAGYKIKVIETGTSVLTDASGYFEIMDLPENTQGYTLEISKKGYLSEWVKIQQLISDTVISSVSHGISLQAGDVDVNNAINMSDVVLLIGSFNSSKGDGRYTSDLDFNMDEAVNMADLLIVVGNFGGIKPA
ncbi:MAG: hypothetical protein N2645_02590 [Clostridia bacterium]|nr:hypothetical protein [Clostridia bacterium]